MTEPEWIACENPRKMLLYLDANGKRPSNRKLRLFACACCRLAGHTKPDIVDGYEENGPPQDDYGDEQTTDLKWAMGWTERGSGKPTSAEKAALIREIVGNPWHPHPVLRGRCGHLLRPDLYDSCSLCGTVRQATQCIYEQRDWKSLPILADMVEEFAWAPDDVLEHLRGPGPHVRGCWAVDLVRWQT